MASRIKGITVEIGGDTTGLEKALQQVTWAKIKETISGFCQGIVDRFNSLGFEFKNITEIIKAVWDGFCIFLAPVFEGAFSIISTVLSTVLDHILNVVDFFIAVFHGDWEGAWEAVKNLP